MPGQVLTAELHHITDRDVENNGLQFQTLPLPSSRSPPPSHVQCRLLFKFLHCFLVCLRRADENLKCTPQCNIQNGQMPAHLLSSLPPSLRQTVQAAVGANWIPSLFLSLAIHRPVATLAAEYSYAAYLLFSLPMS
eukprot:3835584-Rhodomonas_salina.2